MMSVEKITAILSYAALGAFAAYLGMWWTDTGQRSYLVPMVSALAVAVTGLWVVAPSRKRLAHSGTVLLRRRRYHARLEKSLKIAQTAGSPPATPEPVAAERDGEAALIGHELKN
ncbi:MAG: hypothetical protein ABIW76_22800, partial [Fibrobacteria bacterium]